MGDDPAPESGSGVGRGSGAGADPGTNTAADPGAGSASGGRPDGGSGDEGEDRDGDGRAGDAPVERRDVPDRPGLGGFLAGLGVERNAAVGMAVGVAVAALVYAVRVFELLGPAPSGAGGPGLFLALAFVLAVGTAMLVTVALTVLAAYREAREL